MTLLPLIVAIISNAPATTATDNPSYLVWDVAPLGIEVRTADLLNDMLVLELEKILGNQLLKAAPEVTPSVRRSVEDCGRTASCFAEIGGALGVDRVIVGVASTLGDAYSLNIKLIDVRTGEAVSKAQASLTGERDKMLAAMQTLVFDLIDPSLLHGTLMVEIGMDGVDVFVDGKLVATTPVTTPIEGLSTGEHTLKLSSPVMQDYFTFFNIDVGKTTTLEVQPEEIAALQAQLHAAEAALSVPVYKRWWFWAIIGAVAAGAAGGTIYAVDADGGNPIPSSSLGNVHMR